MPENASKPVIVAGVAQLEGRDPVLDAAAAIARGSGATLHLVHVYELPRLFELAPGLNLAFPEGEESYHDAVLGKLQGVAALNPEARGAVCHALRGAPGACLADVAARVGATVLAVGATRGSRVHAAFLGTTAQRVLRHSQVPVLVVRGPVPRPLRRMLLSTDLTEMSAGVLHTALSVADTLLGARSAEVRVMYVLPWSVLPSPPEVVPLVQTADEELDAFVAEHLDAARPAEPVARIGAPAAEIVAEARRWDAGLVVVGTHARGWGGRLLLGMWQRPRCATRRARCWPFRPSAWRHPWLANPRARSTSPRWREHEGLVPVRGRPPGQHRRPNRITLRG